jgi:hypothetical protein
VNGCLHSRWRAFSFVRYMLTVVLLAACRPSGLQQNRWYGAMSELCALAVRHHEVSVLPASATTPRASRLHKMAQPSGASPGDCCMDMAAGSTALGEIRDRV